MKFNQYFKKRQIEIFKDYYVNYKDLKHTIKIKGNFNDSYQKELKRVNDAIEILKKENSYSDKQMSDFLVLNYMALFKATKKYDKKCKQTQKFNFFTELQNSKFYSYYMSLPREKHNHSKLVIFDKDGTLIDQNAIFGPWIESLISSICTNLDSIIKDKIFKYLGYNQITKQFNSNSVVARGTNTDIINALVNFFEQKEIIHNIKKDNNIIGFIKKDWKPPKLEDDNGKTSIIQCGDINKLFSFLKSQNIKVAICTNDDRMCTEKTIEHLNIKHLIDYLVCGDDPISSKPSPEPIWTICQNLNINVSDTIMVGDTISDVHSGRNAKCGMVVGVLSGNYSDFNLHNADYIIPTIDDLYKLIKK